jgi:hypothetical protein
MTNLLRRLIERNGCSSLTNSHHGERLLPGIYIVVVFACLLSTPHLVSAGENHSEGLSEPFGRSLYGPLQRVGKIEHPLLVECSGMDISLLENDLLWAVNDGGHGPYLFALGGDGRNRGRVLVSGATNRDWEGVDTFLWQGRSMILVADFGDNKEVHDTHTLYIIQEPMLPPLGQFSSSATVPVAWKVVYAYPDRGHDAEGVAVDTSNAAILILTKRDNPPLFFEIPLYPSSDGHPHMAKQVALLKSIPQPTKNDLTHKYGKYRSQPTALDLSPDHRWAVVLTYKHAYLYQRPPHGIWADAFGRVPAVAILPPPEEQRDLRQREAICFAPDGETLVVTSEGQGAGLFRLEMQ